MISNLERK